MSGVSNYLIRMNDSSSNTVIYEDNWTSTSISRYVGYGTFWYWMHSGTTSNYSAATSGSVTCAAPVNGSCGSVNGTSVSSLSSGSAGLCGTGAVSSFSGSGPWSWQCTGSGGGSTASCSAQKTATVVNGSCGSANGTTVSTAPTSGLCNSGTASGVSGSGPWTWTCAGSGGGSTASCSAYLTATCPSSYSNVTVTGSTSGAVWGSSPYTEDSDIGTAAVHAGLIAVGETATIKKTSSGSSSSYVGSTRNGVTTSPYSSPWCGITLSKIATVVNGSCGSVNGTSVSSLSSGSAGLCGTGAVSSFSGSGPWSWQCTGSGGGSTSSCSASLYVAPPAPAFTLTASPTSVVSGSASTITWSSVTNATSCTASNGWTGSKSTAGGSASTGALSTATTYTLSCTGAGGTTTKSATVSVTAPVPAPTLDFSASPTSITTGSSTTLFWSSTNATSCTASNSWSGAKAVSGSLSVSPITTGIINYTLTCTGATAPAVTKTVPVTVTSPVINGSCGLANGTPTASAPTTNLCNVTGTTPTVTGSGPWSWTCTGSGGGTTASCNAPLPSTLRLCRDGILFVTGGNSKSLAMVQNDVANLTTYYDSGSGCSGSIVTSATTFDSTAPLVGKLSGTDPKILTGDVPNSSDPGKQSGTSTVTATYSGQTATILLTVEENCVSGCGAKAPSYCKGKSFQAPDSCGVVETCASGTRTCDMNWKEVAPGL
ncbi:MAG: LCCL domain-containing protein [Candidatus Moraniibacteriota bacterium]